MKKALALLLALVMTVTLFACGKPAADPTEAPKAPEATNAPEAPQETEPPVVGIPDNGEPYEVKVIYRVNPQDEAAHKAVVDHINNNILPEILPNTTVAFEFIPAADYVQNIKLKMANGEKVDLMLGMATYNWFNFATEGAYMAWNDYLQYMPDAMEVLPEGWLAATTIEGNIYGFPNYQTTARKWSWFLDQDAIDAANVDVSKISDYDSFEKEFLEPVAALDMYPMVVSPGNCNIVGNAQAEAFEMAGLEQIAEFVVVDNDDPTKAICLYEAEGAIAVWQKIADWRAKGYYDPDATEGMDEATMLTNKMYASWGGHDIPGKEDTYNINYNRNIIRHNAFEGKVSTAAVRSTMSCLGFTSENPARAAKFFNLMYSNADLFNAVCYGLEGANYTVNEDGSIHTIADSGYAISTWTYQYGNTALQYRPEGRDEKAFYGWVEENENAGFTYLFGFSWVNTDVQNEIAACKAIIDQYSQGLKSGAYTDVAATCKELTEQLYAAGLQTVLDNCQAQLDAWLAANK